MPFPKHTSISLSPSGSSVCLSVVSIKGQNKDFEAYLLKHRSDGCSSLEKSIGGHLSNMTNCPTSLGRAELKAFVFKRSTLLLDDSPISFEMAEVGGKKFIIGKKHEIETRGSLGARSSDVIVDTSRGDIQVKSLPFHLRKLKFLNAFERYRETLESDFESCKGPTGSLKKIHIKKEVQELINLAVKTGVIDKTEGISLSKMLKSNARGALTQLRSDIASAISTVQQKISSGIASITHACSTLLSGLKSLKGKFVPTPGIAIPITTDVKPKNEPSIGRPSISFETRVPLEAPPEEHHRLKESNESVLQEVGEATRQKQEHELQHRKEEEVDQERKGVEKLLECLAHFPSVRFGEVPQRFVTPLHRLPKASIIEMLKRIALDCHPWATKQFAA